MERREVGEEVNVDDATPALCHPAPVAECGDFMDNDRDGDRDTEDSSCRHPFDSSES